MRLITQIVALQHLHDRLSLKARVQEGGRSTATPAPVLNGVRISVVRIGRLIQRRKAAVTRWIPMRSPRPRRRSPICSSRSTAITCRSTGRARSTAGTVSTSTARRSATGSARRRGSSSQRFIHADYGPTAMLSSRAFLALARRFLTPRSSATKNVGSDFWAPLMNTRFKSGGSGSINIAIASS